MVLLLIPLNRWLALKIQSTSNALMAAKDCRLKRMGELLSGIRQIKTAAWEPAFAKRVCVLRPVWALHDISPKQHAPGWRLESRVSYGNKL